MPFDAANCNEGGEWKSEMFKKLIGVILRMFSRVSNMLALEVWGKKFLNKNRNWIPHENDLPTCFQDVNLSLTFSLPSAAPTNAVNFQ